MEKHAPFEVELEAEEQTDEWPVTKIIIGAVILLVVIAAYFVINLYLEASSATLYLSIKDVQKKPIVNSRVDIIDSYGKMRTQMGKALYKFELGAGTYEVIVRSPGFKEKRFELNLEGDKELTITLEKEYFMKIVNVEIPPQLICPSKRYGTITIANTSEKDDFASVSFEGFSGLQLSLIPEKLLVPANQNASATIELKCSKVANKKEVEGSIALADSNDKNFFTITLLPAPKIEFEKELSIELDVNESKVLVLTFQNRASFEVTGLLLKIEGVKDVDRQAELSDVLSFSETELILEKEFSLGPNGIERINVYIKGVPREAEATLSLSADFYSKPEKIIINIKPEGSE
jgi:HSP20 family molecular chaperone IbpA